MIHLTTITPEDCTLQPTPPSTLRLMTLFPQQVYTATSSTIMTTENRGLPTKHPNNPPQVPRASMERTLYFLQAKHKIPKTHIPSRALPWQPILLVSPNHLSMIQLIVSTGSKLLAWSMKKIVSMGLLRIHTGLVCEEKIPKYWSD